MDSNLPIIDGIALVKEIQKLIRPLMQMKNARGKSNNKLPVIYMYTNGGKRMKQQTKGLGIDFLVPKPIRYDQLKNALISKGII